MNALTFCVPRAEMPQVDDVPALLEWLAGRGVGWFHQRSDAAEFRRHQHVVIDRARAAGIPDDKLRSPILVANDGWILDGNHRHALLQARGLQVEAYVVGLSFGEALTLLARCPLVRHSDGEK